MLSKSTTKRSKKEMVELKTEVNRRRGTDFYWNFRRAYLLMGHLLEWLLKEVAERESLPRIRRTFRRVGIAKESKIKSSQATNEQYISKCIFYDQLQFLPLVLASAKSRDSIGSAEIDLECSISITENEPPTKKAAHKESMAERKLDLLNNCVESMTQLPLMINLLKMAHFALFIKGKIK